MAEHEELTKEQLIQEIRDAIEELRLIEEGKLTARSAYELLDEL